MSYFGRNIRKIRNAKNISQTEFAKLFNLTRASIGAYEEGRAEAKIDTIISIANYFEISIDTLLVEELTLNDIFHLSKRTKAISDKNKATNKPIKNHNDEYLNSKGYSSIEQRLFRIETKLNNIEKLLINTSLN